MPSARRATLRYGLLGFDFQISIHALREEGDPFHARFRRWKADFYPRPPRGGRLDGWNAGLLTKDISIHALREEGD